MDLERALRVINKTLGVSPTVIETRVIRYLATIDDFAAESAAGAQMFGKRYTRDVRPLVVAERARRRDLGDPQ